MSDKIPFDFDEYIRQSEPDKQQKGYIWQTAIGLQDVDGVYKFAGMIRDYNISKKEWILKGKSLVYAGADTIKDTLNYDFDLEKSFDYSALSIDESLKHITGFIANMWQIHPFGEGNTRTTAVFAIKYLRSLGFDVTNTLFADNSWYFRNALVRANYADIQKGIYEDKSYLEKFFRNLILGEKNEMKNRYLIIGTDFGTAEKIGDKQKIGDKKSAINIRTKQAIVDFMKDKEFVKARDVAEAIELKPSRTREYLGELVKEGTIIACQRRRKCPPALFVLCNTNPDTRR